MVYRFLFEDQVHVPESPCGGVCLDGVAGGLLFKVYFPILYYCAYFSVRADDFDLIAMSKGKDAVKRTDARNQ